MHRLNSLTKKKRTQRNRHGDTSIHIPEDLLLEIFRKQPLRCIIKCKQVSKSWNRLISDDLFPASNLPMTHLICCRKDHRPVIEWKCNKKKPVDFSTIYIEDIRKLESGNIFDSNPLYLHYLPWQGHKRRQFSILDSCNGLLLCLINPDIYLIVNPSNETWISIPSLPSPWLELEYGRPSPNDFVLDFDQNVSNQIKVLLPIRHINRIRISIFTFDSGRWKTSKYIRLPKGPDNDQFTFGNIHSSPRIIDGKLYLFILAKLVKFNIADETTELLELPLYDEKSEYYLDVWRGSLRLSQLFHRAIKVWEFEERSTGSWILKYNLSFDDALEGLDLSHVTFLYLRRCYPSPPCFHYNKDAFFLRIGKCYLLYYNFENKENKLISLEEEFSWCGRLYPLSLCFLNLFKINC